MHKCNAKKKQCEFASSYGACLESSAYNCEEAKRNHEQSKKQKIKKEKAHKPVDCQYLKYCTVSVKECPKRLKNGS